MIKQQLHEGWTVRAVGDLSEVPQPLRGLAITARVPGCVTTDLLRAGKIDDPYRDLNEFKTRWIGNTDWEYRTTFEADAKLFDHERIDLACDGLDTVATIELNGSRVAQTQNMHRSYRFDVRPLLKRGANELRITFASPVKYAEAMHAKNPRPYVNGPGGHFNAIRKMACNFGWDWGPALPTSGIWRGIRLEGWSSARITNVKSQWRPPHLELDIAWEPASANPRQFELSVALSRDGDRSDGDGKLLDLLDGPTSASVSLLVEEPALWWPMGHGPQPLYDLWINVLTYGTGPGESFKAKVGLRTVELDSSPDDIGRKFVLKVNGKPIFAKGFNWIPDDCFLDRACEPTRVRQRIQQAIDAGGNMLRVWGGGIFETDDFYNICDELGVLVWQDFLFACAMYAEEEPYWSEVEAEARDNVARLAHHPSLAIWNGCNENIWAYRDWGWKDHEQVKGKTWGTGFYFDLLPKICKELTPSIPYWAGSPWSGDYDVDNGVPPNADTHGNKHVWEASSVADYRNFRQFQPRFASEFGVQGPSNYSTIARVIPPEARDFGSPEMRHRQKAGDPIRDDADRKHLRQIVRDFNIPGAAELLAALDPPDPKARLPECGCAPLHPARTLPSRVNFDDLHYLLSVQQCRALTTAVEFWRSHQPRCMGTLYWQLNDCWPGGTTWSCIDGDGKRKLLWYATRKFFADHLFTIQPEPGGSLHLCVINDSDTLKHYSHCVARRSFDGNAIAWQTIEIEAPPRSVVRKQLPADVATPVDAARELITVDTTPRTTWFFAIDRQLCYSPATFASELHRAGDVYELTIKAKTLLRDVCVFADRLDPDAMVGEQLVTLLPGESFPFVIHSKRELTKEQLTSPPVLRYVNDFGATAGTAP